MKDPLENILKAGVFFVFSALVIVVAFQIFSRTFFPDFSQIWTEEVTRFLFIYSIALSAPLAMKRRAYVNIDLVNSLPDRLLIPLKIAIELLFIALFIIIFYQGIHFTALGTAQRAPTIKIPISTVFAAVPVMGGLMTYYAVGNLIRFIRHIKTGGDARSWS